MKQQSRLGTIILIAILVLIWGASWPVYKNALSSTPPLLFAGMRTFLGGLVLSLIAFLSGKKIHFRSNIRIYLLSAFFNVFLFFGLQTIGLTYMPGGLFSVIIYVQPILVGILAWLWLGESMTVPKIAGLVIGFAGVTIASFHSLSMNISVIGLILALLTAVSWTFGAIFLKKESGKVDPMWLISIQSLLGGTTLLILGLNLESWTAIVWDAAYLAGLSFGMFLGVPTAWVIYFLLIRSGEASKVATSTFLVPVIAVAGGALFLGEPFHGSLIVGLVLIALSIYLVNAPQNRGLNKKKPSRLSNKSPLSR